MRLYRSTVLNEQGRRSNNEDSVYPPPGVASKNDALYMVCDGVGGQEKGQVASAILCHEFPQFLFDHPIDPEDAECLDRGLAYVEKAMAAHVKANPKAKGMASTLTLACFLDRSVWLAWVGDSRIYHVRDGEILYRTQDHSLVADLVRKGELTEEEALHHPRKNFILRAVKGTGKPAQLDQRMIHDVQAGDYFLLCTDGMLETVNEGWIGQWMRAELSCEEIATEMALQAEGHTKDNYSMYLIKVESVPEMVEMPPKPRQQKRAKTLMPALYGLALLTLLAIMGFLYQQQNEAPAGAPVGVDKPKPKPELPAPTPVVVSPPPVVAPPLPADTVRPEEELPRLSRRGMDPQWDSLPTLEMLVPGLLNEQ